MDPRLKSEYAQKRGHQRPQWTNKKEFILSVAGGIVGLGNVWRFPYLCFKNGGGAFLIPYIFFLFTCGIPIFFLEISVGQLTCQAGLTCWRKICPLIAGLGYSGESIALFTSMYYIVIMAWSLLYIFCSFHTVLPWASCNNTWNTENCTEHGQNASLHSHNNDSLTSPVLEFWQRRILGLSAGIDEMGSMRWDLLGCLLLNWIVCYFCIWKGIKTSGKVVYFTATFPYVILFALLIRALTLPGAVDGIRYYVFPDPTRLTDPQVWLDAGSQIFFSYLVCYGCLPSLGSYNRYNNDCYRDSFVLCLLNSLSSLVAGFAVFSVLGFMSHELGVDIADVAESGPGLAFIAYPRAVAMMPLPQLWAVFFFIMIILLGMDSQFVTLECLVTSLSDIYPSFFYTGHRSKLLLLFICALCFAVSVIIVTEGGLYLFLLFDYYVCSGMPIMLFAIIESICVGWIFGADRYYEQLRDMIGYYPSCYMKYCWRFFTPSICAATLLFFAVNFTPLTYNKTYQFPWWATAIGLGISVSTVLLTPLFTVYNVAVMQGPMMQRLRALCTPAADMLRASPEMNDPTETPLSSTALQAWTEKPENSGAEESPCV